jgi:hypothetical protein
MLKAVRTPPIPNISVDWGCPAVKAQSTEKVASPADIDDFEIVEEVNEKKKTLNILDESIDIPMDVDSTPAPPAPSVVLSPRCSRRRSQFGTYSPISV